MLETAYVLPVMVAVILLTVEVIGYAMNSFAVNDVLTDVHSTILSEVSTVSNLDAGKLLDPSIQYASCSSDGKVVLPTGINSSINTIVTTALASRHITFTASDPGVTKITKSVVSGFDVYVVNFSGTANTLVIPNMFSILLPISVDTVISVKDSCEP
ncbi:hypothetical protein [Thiomicrorhabdus sp.]|uniref:hypothetical protein n=1 Tax=Thiomicrorhabdus sp. TaxID=2039724 RepID=UPI002AA801D1|nr:hypothetical protein [Thiomicrorhabdus sp.]